MSRNSVGGVAGVAILSLVSLVLLVDDTDVNDIIVILDLEMDENGIEVGKENFVIFVDDTLNGIDVKIFGIINEDSVDGNTHNNETLTSLSSLFCSS